MKKSLTVCALLIISIAASAQRQGLWVMPHLAVGANIMNNGSSSSYQERFFSIMNSGGVDASYMITNRIGFGAGIGLGWYRSRLISVHATSSGPINQIKTAQTTVDVPVFFRYVRDKSGRGFFFNAGFIQHFLAGAKYEMRLNGKVYYDEKDRSSYASYGLSTFVYCGGTIRCGNGVQIIFGPQMQYQLTNNFASKSPAQGHHFSCAFKVGVGIHAYKHEIK